MTDVRNRSQGAAAAVSIILFYGALWGIAEATLGFLLHWVPRFLPVANLAGLVMFPIGLLFMTAAVRSTGKPAAALGTAVVTAGIKLSSAALPFVAFRFVRSPVLAIAAEGTVVFLLLSATELRPGATLFPKALLASVLWRSVFLTFSALLGFQGGILAKPAQVLLGFLLLDSSVNAVIITAAILLFHRKRRVGGATVTPVPAPLMSAAVLLMSVAVETVGALA